MHDMIGKLLSLAAIALVAGCILDTGPAPSDMIDLGTGEAARGCIARRPDPEGRTCIVPGLHDAPTECPARAVSTWEGELGCCLPGVTEGGEPAVRWVDCEMP